VRVAVIGNSGGGKTRLARRLGDELGVPVHEVDAVQWLPGWERRAPEETEAAVRAWAAGDRWVIDGWGGSPDVLEERFVRADVVVLVDLPVRTHLRWALQRQATSWLRGRAWAGNTRPPPTALVVRNILDVERRRLPELRTLLERAQIQAKVVRVSSPRGLARLTLLAQEGEDLRLEGGVEERR
jgi:adenylate kinase family enzyme